MTADIPIAFVNARVIDPASQEDFLGGVYARDGVIAGRGPKVTPDNLPDTVRIIDCQGDIIAPGLIDLQAFVGEPGAEYRETIATSTAAAAAGGITTILARSDTTPPIDDPAVVDFLRRRARDTGAVRVLPAATLTQGREGKIISEIGLLLEAGAVAFSDANLAVRNAQVMRRALTYARDFDALVIHFPEDSDLAGEGVMNAGAFATRLGLAGCSWLAETIMLERDLQLVALTGARYHAALISCSASLAAIARAKQAGVKATCAVSINHLTLNETDIGEYRTFLKLRPPLRSEDERRALVAAVRDGLIDAIVSDHDPQDVDAKRVPFAEAEFGAIGLETMLSAALRLYHAQDIDLIALLRAMTSQPADILRLPQGRLAIGAPADIIRFDPDEPYILDPNTLHSRSRNTPFDENRMQGRVKATVVAGAIVYERKSRD